MKPMLIAGLAALLSACAVGPSYKQPNVPAPVQFRGATQAETAESIADVQWADVYSDEALRSLIDGALRNN
jgi:outer membrane protein TolC